MGVVLLVLLLIVFSYLVLFIKYILKFIFKSYNILLLTTALYLISLIIHNEQVINQILTSIIPIFMNLPIMFRDNIH